MHFLAHTMSNHILRGHFHFEGSGHISIRFEFTCLKFAMHINLINIYNMFVFAKSTFMVKVIGTKIQSTVTDIQWFIMIFVMLNCRTTSGLFLNKKHNIGN